ncbi:MAG: phosphogluconate dehydratase [Nitratireductor sp.]
MSVKKPIDEITNRIIERSKKSREAYLGVVDEQVSAGVNRSSLSCGNLAHAFAACGTADKEALSGEVVQNIGIINSYNDMLSAHQPYKDYPDVIKMAANELGGVAQVAGGVPAMCDGVTQGMPGMELSLFSRDVIALATAIGLSHNMFDAAMYLGICDKIVPGLLIGALSFGHIPAVFVPAGPMPSGITNDEKAKTRQLFQEGKVDRAALLESESKAYHSPGTCTFYGTANSNQMLMEIMGLHLPGSSFIAPGTPLREGLTKRATERALQITANGDEFTPVGHVIDAKAIVNGIVGLHATGGSTNHVLHLVAIARAAGIQLELGDIADLSAHVPLLARVYPNGFADVNHFHAAGGMPFLIKQLLDGGLLHEDVKTIMGNSLRNHAQEPVLGKNGEVVFQDTPEESGNDKIVTTHTKPFSKTGGIKMLSGNLGKAMTKISAVKAERHIVEAPAIVFHDQKEIIEAFNKNELNKDFIAVLRFQGPKACGMPELHKMVQPLGILLDRGHNLALVTDGRMSGASGKVPSAIHVTPEAADEGLIAKVEDGDMIRLDATNGTLTLLVDEEVLARRSFCKVDLSANETGIGRDLFRNFRHVVGGAAEGASSLY